jgi:hypothetical protein
MVPGVKRTYIRPAPGSGLPSTTHAMFSLPRPAIKKSRYPADSCPDPAKPGLEHEWSAPGFVDAPPGSL